MLLPSWLYTGVFYGLLFISCVALLYYAYRPKRRRPQDEPLPQATIPVPARRKVLRWTPLACLIGGALGAWWMNHVSINIIRVRDIDGAPHVERMKRLGTPDVPLAPGTGPGEYSFYDTWVINDSARVVRVETFSYGRIGFGGDPTLIPPGTAYVTSGVEYLGPHEHPPDVIEADGVETKLGSTSRSWLTWDP